MNSKICVSIGDTPFFTCLKLASIYPLVEIRLDQMKLDPEKIDILSMQCRQWIATCRPGKYTERERTTLLSASIHAGAAYVDIEYESDPEYRKTLTDLAKRNHCKVIISYHNYESTPAISEMNEIVVRSKKEMNADYVKLAVTANHSFDCLELMKIYLTHDNLIAFAMGEAGKITRIAAPFLGAAFTYASVDHANQTAPGQLTVSEMETIFRIINKDNKNIIFYE